MRLQVEFHPSAREEFEAAYSWYRDRGIDVALRFLREIELAIDRIPKSQAWGARTSTIAGASYAAGFHF